VTRHRARLTEPAPGSAGILAGVFVFAPPHHAGKDAGAPRTPDTSFKMHPPGRKTENGIDAPGQKRRVTITDLRWYSALS